MTIFWRVGTCYEGITKWNSIFYNSENDANWAADQLVREGHSRDVIVIQSEDLFSYLDHGECDGSCCENNFGLFD